MIFRRSQDSHQKRPTLLNSFDQTGCHYESDSPAAVYNWLNRRDNKIRRVPVQWTESVSSFKNQTSSARIAVVLHVYYLDLVDELLDGLNNLPVEFDLIVSNASGVSIGNKLEKSRACRSVELMVENHGRDILPLVHVVNAGLISDYDLVLKLHTKKSAWRASHESFQDDGESWKDSFLSELVGSPETVVGILNAFAEDPSIGAITAEGNVLDESFWGDNQATTAQLMWRLQMHLERRQLEFAAGSMYWIRGFLLQGLSTLELAPDDFEPEAGQVNATTAHAVERLIGLLTSEAGYRTVGTQWLGAQAQQSGGWTRYTAGSERRANARVVPFYLPQFHRVEENDEWWGTGFTEWSNVTAARPNFLGHNQPLLPSELGYYDLEENTVRDEQWAIANQHGIAGFMYYYYWFAGRKILEKPIELLLQSETKSPFCIMWANENWTRSWDGGSKDVLLGQDYEEHPAAEFLRDILPLISDERYFRIDGKPVIAVYKVTQIPNLAEVIEEWRETARSAGVGELYVMACDLGSVMHGIDGHPGNYGLDGVLEFPPHNHYWSIGELDTRAINEAFNGRVVSYHQTQRRAEEKLFRTRVDEWRSPGVMVHFDNTARRQLDSDVWIGSNPYTFHRWLKAAISALANRPIQERVIFVNAWNEWAEGAVLEPSVRWGRSFLQAAREAIYQ